MQSTVTPIKTPEQVLAAAASEQLVDDIVRLTHRIHGLRTSDPARAQELRVQRGMLRAEVLRRIGGNR